MAIISFCTIHTFLLYKNCIQRKLHCSVLQFTDTASQWLFKALTEFKLSFFRLPGGTSQWCPSLTGSLIQTRVLWSSGYRKEPWGRYWYLLCTHTLLVKSNEKQQLQNSPWLPLESLCQKLLFHQSDHLLPQSNPVSLCEFSSSFWKASLSQHWVFLDWFKVLEGSTI